MDDRRICNNLKKEGFAEVRQHPLEAARAPSLTLFGCTTYLP